MPDAGRARPESFIRELPSPRPDYPALPWQCAGATMLNIYFEINKDRLLEYLAPEFNRTSPAHGRIFVIDHPSSAAGPFREATLSLGCRFNMLPASFVAASLTDNPKALAAGLFERGFPTAIGKIEFSANPDEAKAIIGDKDGPLVSVTLGALQTIEPNRLAYDHVDAFRTVTGDDGKVRQELVFASPDFKIEQAAISKSMRIEYLSERDTVWRRLQNRNVISSQLVRGMRTFAAGKPPGAA